MKVAVFPGSFDPITIGHLDIIQRSSKLFDQVIIAIGQNSSKKNMFSLEQRIDWVKQSIEGIHHARVESYSGLTIDFCKTLGAQFIIRGLRNSTDFDFEKNIAQMNRELAPGIDSVFLMCAPQYAPVQSSIVREILLNGGSVSNFLPEVIKHQVSL